MPDQDPGLPTDPDAVVTRDRVWDVALAVAAGGALGGGARFLINSALPSDFPWATFLENVLGCFLLGLLMVFVLEVWPANRYLRPFLGVGVLGGFTTFSAYTVGIVDLVDQQRSLAALVYLFASVLLGLLGTWSGLALGRRWVR